MSEQEAQAQVERAQRAGCIAWICRREIFHSSFNNRSIWSIHIHRQPNE